MDATLAGDLFVRGEDLVTRAAAQVRGDDYHVNTVELTARLERTP